MKKLSTLFVMIILLATIADAKILRVGFTATNPVSGVDFTTLQAAHDAAAIGDTIQIYPTNPSTTYTCTMTKRLNLFGTGYYTDGNYNANTGLQNIIGQCSVTLTLDAGSSGSFFQGLGTPKMTGNGTTSADFLTIGIVQFASVNNITIKRCAVGAITLANYAPNDAWTISQCVFLNLVSGYPISAYTLNPVIPSVGGNAISNLRVENSIFQSIANASGIDLSKAAATGCTGQIVNCVFNNNAGLINFNNGSFLVQNNIFIVSGNFFYNGSNCIPMHCLLLY